MKSHFVAMNEHKKVLVSGERTTDGVVISWRDGRLKGTFRSVEDVLMHPKVESFHWLQQMNESVTPQKKNLSIDGVDVDVDLTFAEYLIFNLLNTKRGEFVSQQMLWRVLENFGNASRNSLRTLVSRLRKKIAKFGVSIETKYKEGYRLK